VQKISLILELETPADMSERSNLAPNGPK